MSKVLRMSEIIRQAASAPVCTPSIYAYAYLTQSESRKRKQTQNETRPLPSSSALDGAVDDLFSIAPAASGSGISGGPMGDLVGGLGSSDKSELVFDSEGNMVLQKVATNSVSISGEATTTVDSATCGYDFAYRKPKPTKWSIEDTNKFYEALEIYGSDQMLINTTLPQFQPQQIRQKFKAEMRNDPKRFNSALYGKKRKALDASKFEEQHGQIRNPVYSCATVDDPLGILDLPDTFETTIDSQSPRNSVEGEPDKPVDAMDLLDSLFQ